jgi:hypothetical protein
VRLEVKAERRHIVGGYIAGGYDEDILERQCPVDGEVRCQKAEDFVATGLGWKADEVVADFRPAGSAKASKKRWMLMDASKYIMT